MTLEEIEAGMDQVLEEVTFTTSRSSGPGGQHVNKVNTRVTLSWDLNTSGFLTEEQRALVHKKLKTHITTQGVLMISSQQYRSQLRNKEDVIRKLKEALLRAFTPVKKRKPSKPSRSAIRKRLDAKRQQAEKKKRRSGLD